MLDEQDKVGSDSAVADRIEAAGAGSHASAREVEVPWDDLRAARVHKRALEAFAAQRASEHLEEEQRIAALEAVLDKPRVPRSAWVAALAAIVIAAAAMVLWIRAGETHATPWAIASLAYADGSRSLLSERAQVQVVDETAEHVAVRQRAGKVRYEIAPRPERRFEVSAHDVTITVLGTVFDVEVADNAVSVSVERGRVQVDHAKQRVVLTVGQRVTITTEGEAPVVAGTPAETPPEPEPVTPPVTVTPTPTPSASASADPAGAAKLLREADEARARGDLDAAVAALGRLLARHPRDARVTVATFTLAQIVRSQGKHELAARHFEACGGALRGDAIAEAAASWSAAGNPERARQNAERYLDAYPSGVHADHMRQLRGGS